MFYVKEKRNDAIKVSMEINDENVFCICPICGCKVNVDLLQIFADRNEDLYGTSVYYNECSKEIRASYGGKGYVHKQI
ncbi:MULTISPECIES: hypothetical protein [Clostridium]|uniref:Uncharacterized protein n=2 Tax=Clostridium TaxID=1485 RepID=A0A381J8V8_9CLOT|nr:MULTISPECIES: hypothetical protein [Clostridium]MBB6630656.1 hypothetical protein [Clostridium algidicarnis]PPK44989.1 hypothetical protein BD821_12135 [Clostridium algidicarnis DSM 15099]SUY47724.1 Uncharacterised protein [Clostridium putrefaciens]